MAGAARHRDQVDDRVGRAALGHRHRDAVGEAVARQHLLSASGRPTPSARCGGRTRRSCGCGWRRPRGSSDAPGKVMPIASAMPIIVAAVPIVMQVPWLRAMPRFHLDPRLVAQAAGAALVPVLEGVRARAQRPCPASCRAASGRPAGRCRACPSRTRPSAGPAWSCRSRPSAPRRRPGAQRSSSSDSIARKLRYSIVVGLTIDSRQADRRQLERKAAGLQHAALDVVDARLKCAWHWLASLQVLTIAITGLPA